MKVLINYRADRRIKVVEIKSGSKMFLTDLEVFMQETGINDFTESHMGKVTISVEAFKSLWKGRVVHAEPNSFRFRRNAKETEETVGI
ncbi:hypothetical protein CampHawk_161 [Bacillus phage CampHawk]|uniref:Uncharacterized protein n=1 Tax=Bacillus phage CampHawk TaxID=1406783 RepID=U5PT52_9CAUD|nr:hypothetical protein CampHawk_161 [Bacillus phage CampHawk]AGY47039.1 hypothetical protein CampHawk_161 [Bacillus phage CampHawk]